MKDEEAPELILASETLRVYLELLKSGNPVGVRELQRKMGFRSPGSSKYHLDKLVRLGLAERTPNGMYKAKASSRLSILSLYVSILGLLIPKMLIYASFITGALLCYIVLLYPHLNVYALLFGVISASIFWVEGIRLLLYLSLIHI